MVSFWLIPPPPLVSNRHLLAYPPSFGLLPPPLMADIICEQPLANGINMCSGAKGRFIMHHGVLTDIPAQRNIRNMVDSLSIPISWYVFVNFFVSFVSESNNILLLITFAIPVKSCINARTWHKSQPTNNLLRQLSLSRKIHHLNTPGWQLTVTH